MRARERRAKSTPRSADLSVSSPKHAEPTRFSRLHRRFSKPSSTAPRRKVAFIDTHRDQFGVELIRRVSRAAITEFLTSRGDRAAKTRPACDREIRDEQSIADLRAAHEKNYSCHGVLKTHQAMKRQGWQLGREQTRRLMRKAGLRGVQRGKPVLTTITDPTEQRPADLVNRQFKAAIPKPVMGGRHHLCAHLAGILLHGRLPPFICACRMCRFAVSSGTGAVAAGRQDWNR